jgi:hypothetical protein
MRNTADVTGGKPIAVLLHPISGVSAINPLVFYDIYGGEREVLFFYFVSDTRQPFFYIRKKNNNNIPFIYEKREHLYTDTFKMNFRFVSLLF